MGLDGLHAEEQLGCDLRVGPALCDEPQDLGFAVGEVRLGEPAAWAAASGREPANGDREEQGSPLWTVLIALVKSSAVERLSRNPRAPACSAS